MQAPCRVGTFLGLPPPTMRRLFALAFVGLSSLLSWRCSVVACGCAPPPVEFGLPYAIAGHPSPALTAPDTLAATVSYTGGCARHAFAAQRAGVDGRRQLYALRHTADPEETCRQMVTARVRVHLPGRDASRPGLVLQRPSGAPIVVVP